MKKTLIALICAGALNPVMANDSVTLYGVIDEGYHKRTHEASDSTGRVSNSTTGIVHGLSSSNYFGLRTSEDLGQGAHTKAAIEFNFGDPEQGSTLRQAWVGIGHQDGGLVRLGHIKTSTHHFLSESNPSSSGHSAGSLYYNRDHETDYASGIQYIVDGTNYSFAASYLYSADKHQVSEKRHVNKTVSGYELAGKINYQSFYGRLAYLHGKTEQTDGTYLYSMENASEAPRHSIVASFGYQIDPQTKLHYTYYHQTEVDAAHRGVDPAQQHADGHQVGFNTYLNPQVEVFGGIMVGHGWEHRPKTNSNEDLYVEPRLLGYQLGGRYHLSPRTDVYSVYGSQTLKGAQSKETEQTFSVGLKHAF